MFTHSLLEAVQDFFCPHQSPSAVHGVAKELEKLSDLLIPKLALKNVPLTTALQYVCSHTGTRYRIEGRNIAILPEKE